MKKFKHKRLSCKKGLHDFHGLADGHLKCYHCGYIEYQNNNISIDLAKAFSIGRKNGKSKSQPVWLEIFMNQPKFKNKRK